MVRKRLAAIAVGMLAIGLPFSPAASGAAAPSGQSAPITAQNLGPRLTGTFQTAIPIGNPASDPRAELSFMRLDYWSNELVLTMRTVQTVDPETDPAWAGSGLGLTYTVDAGPTRYLVYVHRAVSDQPMQADVYDGFSHLRCTGNFRFDATEGYVTSIDPACIGNAIAIEQFAVETDSGFLATGRTELDFYSPTNQFSMIVPRSSGPYWRGQDIARGVALDSVRHGGYELDAFGALHPFRQVGGNMPAAAKGAPYWPGWDIARGVALLPDRTGGYVLDGYGGLHPFGVGSHAPPPAAHGGPQWSGWDIARGVTILPSGTGGYVVDGWGGVHGFAIGTHSMPARATSGPYWPGWTIVRGITMTSAKRGYILDGWGALHPWATRHATPPTAATGSASWPNWDIARGVSAESAGRSGIVVDGYGGLHGFTH